MCAPWPNWQLDLEETVRLAVPDLVEQGFRTKADVYELLDENDLRDILCICGIEEVAQSFRMPPLQVVIHEDGELVHLVSMDNRRLYACKAVVLVSFAQRYVQELPLFRGGSG